jgi:hypothetical protein
MRRGEHGGVSHTASGWLFEYARFFALLVASSCLGCDSAPPDTMPGGAEAPTGTAVSDVGWDGVSTRPYRDHASALRFPVPATGFVVTSTRFAPDSPPIKLKNQLVITRDRGDVVRIDVWVDSEHLGLRGFFDRYLQFMASPDAAVETTRAGSARETAILVRHPRSYQAPAQRHVVLAAGDEIVRVTALDDDDPGARAVFDRIALGIDLEDKQ